MFTGWQMASVHELSSTGSAFMNFFGRTFISSRGNLSKVIILSLVVFILGTVISGAISVNQAVYNTSANLRINLPTVVSVEFDSMAVSEHLEGGTGEWVEVPHWLPAEIYSEIGALPQVRNYDLSAGASLMSTNLSRYSLSSEILHYDDGMGDWLTFHLKGVHSSNLDDIEEGVIKLTAGRTFTDEEVSNLTYVAIVSENFASINGLHVGSTFSLDFVGWDTRELHAFEPSFYAEENILTQKSYEFTIIGLFESHALADTGDSWTDVHILEGIENRIYVPNSVAVVAQTIHFEHEREMYPDDEWLQEDFESLMWFQSVYVLNDPLEVESFKEEVEGIVPPFWTVVGLSNPYADMAASMEIMNSLASAVLLAAIGATVLILSLLITLFIRERKREIGILLALGEARWKVILQMIAEIVVIVLLATVLSLFAGNLIAANISENMLRSDLIAGQAQEEGIEFTMLGEMGFGSITSAEEVIANYNVSLDADTVITFLAVSVGVVVLATVTPALYIIRLSPRKIMM